MPRGSEKVPLVITPGGVRENVNPAGIPEGYLLSASNWLTRQGEGQPRPGYTQLGATLAAADRVIGIGTRGTVDVVSNTVVHTLTAAYTWTGSVYTAKTGTWAAAAAGKPVRMTSFQSGGTLYILRINVDNAIDIWDGGAGNFANATGAPAGVDVTSTANRVLVAAPDGDNLAVKWSAKSDVNTWSAADLARLDSTPGTIIGIRALGPLSAAIYKDDSVWRAVAQAAKAAFQFQHVEDVPGPAGPSAIVPYRGSHYWLAKDGVIYRFDGARVEAVGDQMPATLRNTFDWSRRLETHGAVLIEAEPELWFWYPVSGGGNARAVALNLVTGALTPHTFADSITASLSWVSQTTLTIDGLTGTIDGLDATYSTIDSMGGGAFPTTLMGDTVGKVYQFGNGTQDDGTAIAWEFTHPWKSAAGLGQRLYMDGIASYWKKASSTLTVTVGVTVTDSLGDADTEATSTFDASTDSNHLVTFPNTKGQWVRVKHSAASAVAGLKHRGAAILGWPRNMS